MTTAVTILAADGELSDGQFYGYALLLAITGIAMLLLAATGFASASTGDRLLGGVFGAGFLGYAVYLLLFFDGGTVMIMWYIFILPVILLFQAFRRRSGRART